MTGFSTGIVNMDRERALQNLMGQEGGGGGGGAVEGGGGGGGGGGLESMWRTWGLKTLFLKFR